MIGPTVSDCEAANIWCGISGEVDSSRPLAASCPSTRANKAAWEWSVVKAPLCVRYVAWSAARRALGVEPPAGNICMVNGAPELIAWSTGAGLTVTVDATVLVLA